MVAKADKFWISFILRLAFGLFFLVAAINQFSAGGPRDFGPDAFATGLSSSFDEGWVGELMPTFPNPFHRFIHAGEATDDGEAGAAHAQEAAPAAPASSTEEPKESAGPPVKQVNLAYVFLFILPFVFAGLSVAVLTGILLKPALRAGAVLLVLLGLGKYITSGQDLTTTANDFFLAFLICMGLWFLGQQARAEADAEGEAA